MRLQYFAVPNKFARPLIHFLPIRLTPCPKRYLVRAASSRSKEDSIEQDSVSSTKIEDSLAAAKTKDALHATEMTTSTAGNFLRSEIVSNYQRTISII